MPSYDPNNIFAKILRAELPGLQRPYEDDRTIAFLEHHAVQAAGHTLLVVPKSPARTILDIAPDDLAHAIKVAQKIAKAAFRAGFCRRRSDHHPVQRAGQRPDRVSPAYSRHSAQERRAAAAARQFQGSSSQASWRDQAANLAASLKGA